MLEISCEQWQWVDLRDLRQTRTEIFIVYSDKGPALAMLSAHQRSNPVWPQAGQYMLSDLVPNLATVSHSTKVAKSQIVVPSPLATTLSKQRSTPPFPINYAKFKSSIGCGMHIAALFIQFEVPSLTSKALFSSPVPVNYTKWCVRRWFYQCTVVASNPIITCL